MTKYLLEITYSFRALMYLLGSVSECHKTFLPLWCWCLLSLRFSAAVNAAGGPGLPLGQPSRTMCLQLCASLNNSEHSVCTREDRFVLQVGASQEFLCFLRTQKWNCFYISLSSSVDVSASWFVLLWNWPNSWVCLMTEENSRHNFLSEF